MKKDDEKKLKRTIKYNASVANERKLLDIPIYDQDYLKKRRNEIRAIADKYNLNIISYNYLVRFYINNKNLSDGTISKSADFLALVLKIVYGYTEDEISTFFNRNTFMLGASYGDLRCRLAIFNHIGLLKDVIFLGGAYLTYNFDKEHFGTRSLYAVIMKNNVTSLEELNEIVNRTPEVNLGALKEELPLTSEIIQELDGELQKTIKREARHREFERRKILKGESVMYEVKKDKTAVAVDKKVIKCAGYESSMRDVYQLDEEYVRKKREEVYEIFDRYSINNYQLKRSILLSYLKNKNVPCGDMLKVVTFLESILVNVYDYTTQEISEFFRRNSYIMKATYSDFRYRLAIFNSFGLLENVIFKGSHYLGYEFDNSHFGTRSLYAVMMKNDITSLEELNEFIGRTPEVSLSVLRKEFPLTDEIINELDSKLQKFIKREAFIREFERRKLAKTMKEG